MGGDDPGLRDRRHVSSRLVRFRRALWLVPIGLIALLLLATSAVETTRRQNRAVGIDLEETDIGLRVTAIVPGAPAAAAGLRAGDYLVRVAGRDVEDFEAYDEAASTFLRDAPVDYEIRREGVRQILPLRPGRPLPWLEMIVGWLACLGYLALGSVALIQLPADLRARLLMLLSIGVALELAMPTELLDFPEYGFFSYPFLALLVGFQMGVELHLAASIPDRRRFGRHRRWLVPAFYGIGGTLALMLAASYLADSVGWEFLPWTVNAAELVFWDIAGVVWAATVVLLLATAAIRCPDPLSRQQTLLILLAGTPWAVHFIASVATVQLGFQYPEWLGVAEPLVLLVYPLGILFAIFRFQLFDLELVVKRGLAYTLMTGMLILVFYASIGAGGALVTQFLPGGDTSIWLVGFATLVMGLLFGPLRRATQGLIDRQFFPERTALRRQLVQLASDLPARGNLPAMGRELVNKVCDLFGLESAALLLGAESGILTPLASCGTNARADAALVISSTDPAIRALKRTGRPLPIDHLTTKSPSLEGRLKPLRPAILVPLLRREQLIGVLVLGRKLAGRPFPAEEVELLNLLSHHAATALEYSQLYESATRDSLTGLLRRGAVLDALNRELDRSIRFGRPLSLAMADVDGFKEVNDRYGHLKGDMVLKRVAETMSEGLRLTDQIGRYGGEEFLIVLPETDQTGVYVVAEKLRSLVEDSSMMADNGEEIRVTISIGVVALDPQHGAGRRPEVNELIAAADAALYQAKSGGKNRVEVRAATG